MWHYWPICCFLSTQYHWCSLFQVQLAEFKGMKKAEDESSEYYLGRIEELTHKLSQAEAKVKSVEAKYEAEMEKVDRISLWVVVKFRKACHFCCFCRLRNPVMFCPKRVLKHKICRKWWMTSRPKSRTMKPKCRTLWVSVVTWFVSFSGD